VTPNLGSTLRRQRHHHSAACSFWPCELLSCGTARQLEAIAKVPTQRRRSRPRPATPRLIDLPSEGEGGCARLPLNALKQSRFQRHQKGLAIYAKPTCWNPLTFLIARRPVTKLGYVLLDSNLRDDALVPPLFRHHIRYMVLSFSERDW